MRRTPASSLVSLPSLSALLPALVVLLLGCSKQAEGERCDINNGDLDCDTGLICVGEEQISISGTGFALCCPVTEPTVDACRANMSLPPEPDAGITPVSPAPVTDAGGQTPAPVTPEPDASTTTDGGAADSGT